MFYSDDFKGKPIDSKDLTHFLGNNLEAYKVVQASCALAILGISEEDRMIARAGLESYIGPGFEMAIKEDIGSLSVFGTNNEMDSWQYLVDIPNYYRTFFHKKRGVNFVCVN